MTPPNLSLAQRFWRYVQKSDGCWLWQGAIASTGYGVLNAGRGIGTRGTHRISWELHFGEIPEGRFVCHHCDVRACVRPDHLFLGVAQDNVSDMVRKGRVGDTFPRKNARKTHCIHGHEFTPENTRVYCRPGAQNSERSCRTCASSAAKAWTRAHRDVVNARKRQKRRRVAA